MLPGKPKIDVELERSVADEPKQQQDRSELLTERHYGGAPQDDVSPKLVEVDEEREAREWEKRYGSEESRDRLGYDGLGEK